MSENIEAERATKEAMAKGEIVTLVEEEMENIGNEDLRRYFSPDIIVDGILKTSGNNLEEKARNYFKSEWLHSGWGRIEEMPPEFQAEAKDRVRDLSQRIESAMWKLEK